MLDPLKGPSMALLILSKDPYLVGFIQPVLWFGSLLDVEAGHQCSLKILLSKPR